MQLAWEGCQCLGKGRNRPLDGSSWETGSPGNAEEGEGARTVSGKEGTRSIYKGPGMGICSRRGTRRNTPGPLEEHTTHAHAWPVPGGVQERGKWGPKGASWARWQDHRLKR